MKYVIYEYEEGIKQLFEKYPNLKQYFDNLTLDNDFMNKFINCVYNSVDYMNELIYKELHNRKEYHRVGKMHIFENELTHEISRLYVENYKIIIESKDKTNIFFDILYHNLKSYGLIAGFFASRYFFKKQLQKNPPINEKMIRAMYMEMGRKPSEAQIKRIMASVKSQYK